MDLPIILDRRHPLQRQLHDGLRQAILSGRLSPGERLPPSRDLARTLGVSRSTVVACFEQLMSEGYLEARTGAGTFVSTQIPDDMLQARPAPAPSPEAAPAPLPSAFAERLAAAAPTQGVSIRLGQPALEAFPFEIWRRLLGRHCRPEVMGYAADPLGYRPLRAAIAAYLQRARAVRCDEDQILITAGSQQALDLICRLFVEPGDAVAIEEPGYGGARQAFQTHGARLLPVPVDREGLQVERLPARAKLVYVTPSHQFPTGALLPLARRMALLAWAHEAGAYVVEDDYDSEFRYGSRPVPALQGLAPHGRVLYVGTLSKVLFPSLRLGYVVAPRPLVALLAQAKWLADRQAPLLEQAALADFIGEGHFERHVRRMRQIYGRRRAVLAMALQDHFGDRLTILGEDAGMHMGLRLPPDWPEEALLAAARSAGLPMSSARPHYLGEAPGNEVVVPYAGMEEQAIATAIARLSRHLSAGRS